MNCKYEYSMIELSPGLQFPSIMFPKFPQMCDYMNVVMQLPTLTLNLPLPTDHVIMAIFPSRVIPNDHAR